MEIITKKRIAILGGGPAGLFMFKRLVESNRKDLTIHVFERKKQLGAGMPYSEEGANQEHITNVSGNEIPDLVSPVSEWIETVPKETLSRYAIDPENFNDYKVLPRLLFGQYLSAQFELIVNKAEKDGMDVEVFRGVEVTDLVDLPKYEKVMVMTDANDKPEYDHVIICTGHNWPHKVEGSVSGYFDSPYPPAKLAFKTNDAVAIRGSSLTAIDAIRTLSRANGTFTRENGRLIFKNSEDCPNFKMIMFSASGMLPAIRFHLEDSHLQKDAVLSKAEVDQNRLQNEGFLSLDYVFEKNFKEMFREKEPAFYEQIKDMKMEDFVAAMMDLRERLEPFQLFKAEYTQAEKSIKRKESIYWKEMLAVLSFAMNYPAKYFSAEDMMRLRKDLMPLISIVIAFVPQGSAEEMLALYDAGILELVKVDIESKVLPQSEGGIIYQYNDEQDQPQSPYFKTFVDCIGQPALSFQDFPFKSLVQDQRISSAKLKFRDPAVAMSEMKNGNEKVETNGTENYYLDVPGIAINDNFQVVDAYGAFNERIYIMAVPYIGGYNPDYSGLDFGEAASAAIIESLV
ncbi:FAD/NAD(P)-binding protein [Daejeonella oryzae]|uniref:FAD/NAD(P)-binding protein n=1 Tax=Daejeonella oryzae TaxID=1122943 RepID=UPI000412BA5E|nr:FAD/NAD(P)-binding protein [Daejeonella oryzae]